jgi:hypothetical protein
MPKRFVFDRMLRDSSVRLKQNPSDRHNITFKTSGEMFRSGQLCEIYC